MSKVQEKGLLDALAEAEALARVLRTMSDGKLDLRPIRRLSTMPAHPLNLTWEQARTEAHDIARREPSSAAHREDTK